jgi:homoserine dehydrogenase
MKRSSRSHLLAQVAGILGHNDIGISSVIQPEAHEGESVPLVLMIHDATHAQMQIALAQIAKLACVKKAPKMIRVETFA